MSDLNPLKWRAKRDRDGKIIPRCWQTEQGYTVFETERVVMRFAVTSPGGSLPFAYVKTREEVVAVIRGDLNARGVPA
ncbi:hypothetical protein [Pseudomonas citronellolis]|uniref:hypothetical protein n=1 Tax=Pseudomonas citronellolis TaxID=53408 RepID=UPI001EFBB77C|nr:hypothetical protein [Pseudomonas citronellolis]